MWEAIKNLVKSWIKKIGLAIVLVAVVYAGFSLYTWYDKANNYVEVAGTVVSVSSLCHLRKTEIKDIGEFETSTTEKVSCDVAQHTLENDPSFDGFVVITTKTFLVSYNHEGVEYSDSLTTTRETDQSAGDSIEVLVELGDPAQIIWP